MYGSVHIICHTNWQILIEREVDLKINKNTNECTEGNHKPAISGKVTHVQDGGNPRGNHTDEELKPFPQLTY